MNAFARTSPATSVQVVDIRPPFSFFDLVESEFEGLGSLHRIFSQVRAAGGRTMVVEELGSPDDLLQENHDILTKHPDFTAKSVRRISFFTRVFADADELPHIDGGSFIGYAIAKEDQPQEDR